MDYDSARSSFNSLPQIRDFLARVVSGKTPDGKDFEIGSAAQSSGQSAVSVYELNQAQNDYVKSDDGRFFVGEVDPESTGETVDSTDFWLRTAVTHEYGRNAKDYGALGDGSGATLASRFATLGAAQVKYPFATSLTQTLDWAGIYAAMLSGGDYGVEVFIPTGDYKIFNSGAFSLPSILSVVGENRGRRTIDRASTNNLGTSLDFTGFNLNDFTKGAFYHETGTTGGVTSLRMRGVDLFGPLEINVATDNHAIKLSSCSDCHFSDMRISGFSRAFELTNATHVDMERMNLLRQRTAAVAFSAGAAFVSMKRMHFANSFYATTSGARSGYLTFAATGARHSFITLEDFLADENGQNGLWLDNCDNVVIKQGVAYCSTSQGGGPQTYCVRVGPTARKTTLRDMHIEPYWNDANTNTNSLVIESGALQTLLDRVSTTTKGTQAAGDVYTNGGTGTITRDCILDGTAPSASGQ